MIFFKNNLKRAGLIFNIILAFSYNLSAMEKVQPDLPLCTVTNLFKLTNTNPETKKNPSIHILGTNHLVNFYDLPSEVQKIVLEHRFCLTEGKNFGTYGDLHTCQENEQDCIDHSRQFISASQIKKWVRSKDTKDVLSGKSPEEIEKIQQEVERISGPCLPMTAELETMLQRGFEILYPNLGQGKHPIQFKDLNEKGFDLLAFRCLLLARNRDNINYAKTVLDGKIPDFEERALYDKNPLWHRFEGDTEDYLGLITPNQRAIVEGLFERPERLKDYHFVGLMCLYESAFKMVRSMDRFVENHLLSLEENLDVGDVEARYISKGETTALHDALKLLSDQKEKKIPINKIGAYMKEWAEKLESKDETYNYLTTDVFQLPEDKQNKILDLQSTVLQERNKEWMPKILNLFNEIEKGIAKNPDTNKPINDVILVCGLAHLVGDKGILEELHKERFNIERATTMGEFLPYLIHEKPSTIVEGTKAEETKDPA